MKSIVIACHTISDEIDKTIAETGTQHPVIWIESGLHNYPKILHDKLQEVISNISNVDNIIMAFGYCGNALLGIHADNARMIIPRVDDCISLLMGSYQKRAELSAEMATYFLTKGWIENENNIIREYERCIERYGEKRADRIMHLMLAHYRRLVLIDTGAYSMDDSCLEKSYAFAGKLGLKHQIVTGSLVFLKKLLTGPWDDDFIILQPGEELSLDDFRMDLTASVSSMTMFGFGKGDSR
jgi:hypothetical protein